MIRTRSLYIDSAALLLLTLSLVKICSLLEGKPILQAQDSLLHLSYGTITCVSAMIELGIVFLILFGRNSLVKLGALVALSLSFMLYHFGKWYLHLGGPCPCLGTIAGWLPISENSADYLLKCLIAYFFWGGFGFYFLELKCGRHRSSARSRTKETLSSLPVQGSG